MLATWRDRWTAEVLHEFDQQGWGLEAAQGRQEEAVTRHCRWSGVAPSLSQRAPAVASKSERDAFAEGRIPISAYLRLFSSPPLLA
jgi:hypothetical protein